MEQGYDQRVKVVNEGWDEKVLVVNGAVLNLDPVDGDLIVYENGAYSVRHLADGDIPAAIARDSETTAAVAAEAGSRIAADTAHAAATTGVHGVGGSTVESVAGSQAKADAAQAAAQAASVAKTLYDANTVLAATTDDTPFALSVPASTLVGRKASGGIVAMTMAELKTLLALVEGDVTNLTTDLAAKLAKATLTAKGDLYVATASGVVTRIGVGTDGYSLIADSTTTEGVAWKPRSRVTDEAHTDGSVVNSVSKTAIATLAIPTTVGVGDRLDVVCGGDLLNNTGSGVTYLPEFKIGATTVNQSGTALVSSSLTAVATRRSWRFTGSIYVLATNSEFMDGILQIGLASGAQGVGATVQISGTAAEDLTAGKNFVLSMTLGTANSLADFVCHAASLSILKKA